MLSKRLSLIIISIILGLSLIAGITTAIVVTQPKFDAYIGTEEDVSIGNLLAEDGSLRNPATVTILLDKIDAIGSVSGVVTAQNINNGNPLIFEMGEVNGNPIYWQVVYRTGDYITVWMCEPYTTTRYNNSTPYVAYSSSRIRTTINSMYETFAHCSELTEMPEIPNGMIDMTSTFYNCINLQNTTNIPKRTK